MTQAVQDGGRSFGVDAPGGRLVLASASTSRAGLLTAAGVSTPAEVRMRHAVGCDHCGGKGYKGRLGIYEILQNSRSVKQLIQDRARPTEIFDVAVREGMRSLRHDALEKVVTLLRGWDFQPARLTHSGNDVST